ncbi:hypothetical protein TNCV_1990151, partial [Trichonephila clavipes]
MATGSYLTPNYSRSQSENKEIFTTYGPTMSKTDSRKKRTLAG